MKWFMIWVMPIMMPVMMITIPMISIIESEMQPGGVFVFLRIEEGMEYTVGFHAEQPKGTPITVMAYDGNHTQEPYEFQSE